jgi:hypothetical protein
MLMSHLKLLNPRRIGFGLLFLLANCSAKTVSPKHQGIVGQPLDAVVKCIQENNGSADTMGFSKGQTFEVYMTPLPDENGGLSDEGIVQISDVY